MNVRYVGLDVHKRVVEACFLDSAGVVVKRHRFDLTAITLVEFAREHLQPTDRVALEATTNTWAVVRILQPFVTEVAVGNPLKTRHIAEAHVKTDKVDAEVLAQLLRCNYLPRVWVPDEATSQLRELVARRTAFVSERTAIRNRIHSTLATRLLMFDKCRLFGAAGLAWLKEMDLDPQARLLIDCELRLHDEVSEQIAVLDEHLARRGYSDERVKLLMTLPGVDVAVAEALIAALGDVQRFKDADHAASYLGLVPRTKRDDGFDFDFEHDRLMLDVKTGDRFQGGGFGPTVQLDDGTLVTSCSYRGPDEKTHLEVIRWRAPETN